MNFEQLTRAVEAAAAIRARSHLQPAGGGGDKIFPPTYEGGRYARETRIVDGEQVPCVLLDSVQSQANRFEAALQDGIDRGRATLPVIRVGFPPSVAQELGPITSLTAPHRCYDAILRDSDHDGVAFPKSDVGRALAAARPADATALLRWCPTALVFGAWDSTGARGGMGAKFARAVSSEIIGIGAEGGVRTSSRIDPLGIRREVQVVASEEDRSIWRLAAAADKKAKRPSEVNHGNFPPSIGETGGVTLARAEEIWVLSLPALRRYRFPANGAEDDRRDLAAQVALAALAVAARALAREEGYFLRSRCHLVPVQGSARFELVARDGSVSEVQEPTAAAAVGLLREAVEAARAHGLDWEEQPVELVAQDRLVELVRRSFELAPGPSEE